MMLTLNTPRSLFVEVDEEGRGAFDLACTPIAQWQIKAPGYWSRNQFVHEEGFKLLPGITRTRDDAICIPRRRARLGPKVSDRRDQRFQIAGTKGFR